MRRTDTQFEVCLEKYDYFFTKQTNRHYDYITTTDAETARKWAYYKHGDAIDIIHVKVAD